MSLFEEEFNATATLALYTVSPAISAEGDEDDATVLGWLKDLFASERLKYQGFTWPEKAERLQPITGAEITNLFFTVDINGVTPFNSEEDFTPGIKMALSTASGVITSANYNLESGKLERLDIKITKALN